MAVRAIGLPSAARVSRRRTKTTPARERAASYQGIGTPS